MGCLRQLAGCSSCRKVAGLPPKGESYIERTIKAPAKRYTIGDGARSTAKRRTAILKSSQLELILVSIGVCLNRFYCAFAARFPFRIPIPRLFNMLPNHHNFVDERYSIARLG